MVRILNEYIKQFLDENGYVLVGEYKNTYQKIEIVDLYGYRYMSSIKQLKKYKPQKFHKNNPFTTYNIELFLKIKESKLRLSPNQTYYSNKQYLLFTCEIHGDINRSVNQLIYNQKCSYCEGTSTRVWFGNSIANQRPDLIKYLKNPNDAEKYAINSEKYIKLKCPYCNKNFEKQVFSITSNGFKCIYCKDDISIPEKFCRGILNDININFKPQQSFYWSNNKRYDFYIKSMNIIIEVHGEQHYYKSNRGNRTLQEEQENDKLKYDLAIQNGIKPENYIIVDCRKSEFNWLKDNFIKSLSNHFDIRELDYEKIYHRCSTGNLLLSCWIWDNGIKSVTVISNYLKLGRSTVIRYLKIGTEI